MVELACVKGSDGFSDFGDFVFDAFPSFLDDFADVIVVRVGGTKIGEKLHVLTFLSEFSGNVDSITVLYKDPNSSGHLLDVFEIVSLVDSIDGLGFDIFREAFIIEHLDEDILI